MREYVLVAHLDYFNCTRLNADGIHPRLLPVMTIFQVYVACHQFLVNCLHFLEGLGQTSAGFRTALTNCCIYRLRANSASPFSKSLLSNISAGCTPRPTHSSIRKHTSRLSHPYARAHTQINTPSSRNEYSHIQYTI